jgi:hypothetical protein
MTKTPVFGSDLLKDLTPEEFQSRYMTGCKGLGLIKYITPLAEPDKHCRAHVGSQGRANPRHTLAPFGASQIQEGGARRALESLVGVQCVVWWNLHVVRCPLLVEIVRQKVWLLCRWNNGTILRRLGLSFRC